MDSDAPEAPTAPVQQQNVTVSGSYLSNRQNAAKIALGLLLACFTLFLVMSADFRIPSSGVMSGGSSNNLKKTIENYLPPIFGFKFEGKYSINDNDVCVSNGKFLLSVIYRKLHIIKLYRTFVTIRLEADKPHGPKKYTTLALGGNAIGLNLVDLPTILPLRAVVPDLKLYYQGHNLFDKKHNHRKGIDKSFNLPFLAASKDLTKTIVEDGLPHLCGLSGYLRIDTADTIKSQPSYTEYDDYYLSAYRDHNILYRNYQQKLSNQMDSVNLIKYFKPQYKTYEMDREQVHEWEDGWDKRLGDVWKDSHEAIVTDKTEADSELVGKISSTCGFSLSLSGKQVDASNFKYKIYTALGVYGVRSLVEFGISFYQLKLIGTDSEASRISIVSYFMISLLEVSEVFLLLIHATSIPVSLITLGVILFVKFAIISIVQMKTIILIFRSNYHLSNPTVPQLQSGLLHILKKYFCMVLAITVYFFLYYSDKTLIILPLYLCWVPQICLDIWKGQRRSMNMPFVYLIALSKMGLALYVFYCPKNLFRTEVFIEVTELPNKPFSFFVLTATLIQLAVMTIQKLIDPRWIASYDFLPKIYNYERSWSGVDGEAMECVICMSQIQFKGRNWCVTPCDHIFHTCCLMEWTRVRLECPNCRSELRFI